MKDPAMTDGVLPAKINRLIGRAMHDYEMLADGDRILIAVSGGIDSLFLTRVLDLWRLKAPINYELLAVYLDMGFNKDDSAPVQRRLERLDVPFLIEKTHYGKKAVLAEQGKSTCYHCARQRRNRLFELAKDNHCSKIAFGHHREDIIETFFLNLLYSGNLSTMIPRQDLFKGGMAIIRPLAYLEKEQIMETAGSLGIKAVINPCPFSENSRRAEVRELVKQIHKGDARKKANMFAALANIKPEYLLTRNGPQHAASASHSRPVR